MARIISNRVLVRPPGAADKARGIHLRSKDTSPFFSDAKKTLRLVEKHTQRPDHPYIPTLPETEYLKGFLFEVMPGW